MKKIWIKEHWLEILLCIGIAMQVVALAVFNLTRLPYESNYDSSCAYAQIVEIWRQKSLILKDWSYQTTLGIDSPVTLGALFYGMVKNAFTAFGMANLVTVLIYIALFYDILRRAEVKRSMRLVSILFLLTPYSMGQLGYMPMLFTSAGSYAYKLFVPLLLMDILICMHKGQGIKKCWYLILAASVFVFATAVSSGEYILLCGVLPLIGYEVLHVLLENDWKKLWNGRFGLLFAESALYVVGIKVAGRIGVGSVGEGMLLTKAKDFPSAIGKCLTGIFQLFGGIPDHEDIAVTQVYGMMYLLRFFLAAIVLASWIFLLVRLREDRRYKELVGMISCIFAVNMIVLIFANVTYASDTFEYRYHLISMVPMMLLTGIAASELLQRKHLLPQTFVVTAALVLFLVNGYNYKNYLRDCYNYQGDMQAITAIAEQEGAGLIITIGPDSVQMGRCMRNVNPKVEISTWKSYNKGVGWGMSTYYFENSHIRMPFMVLSTEKDYAEIPEYIARHLEKVQVFGEFQLYRIREKILDGDNSLPESGENVDFCYSSGYDTAGKIDENGYLLTSGKKETALRSNKKKVKKENAYDIVVRYEVLKAKQEDAAVFRIRNAQDEIVAEQVMPKGEREIRLENVTVTEHMEWIRYRVNTEKGSVLRIKSIETIAQ